MQSSGSLSIQHIVGPTVGLVDGVAVGDFEDGAEDGLEEGLRDGLADGAFDGDIDGVFVGVIEGLGDGADEGISEGEADGGLEGAPVGDCVQHTLQVVGQAAFCSLLQLPGIKYLQTPTEVIKICNFTLSVEHSGTKVGEGVGDHVGSVGHPLQRRGQTDIKCAFAQSLALYLEQKGMGSNGCQHGVGDEVGTLRATDGETLGAGVG